MHHSTPDRRDFRRPVRALLRAVAGAAALGLAALAQAQDWPAKPVRIIVPYPAGGVTDVVTRQVAARLATQLGQPVLVDNRSGGATMIGTGAAARSAPDGYTLLATANVFAVNVILRKTPSYRVEDFVPVVPFGGYAYALAVHPSAPAKNVAELVAWAKREPAKVNAVSLGPGGVTHLLTERFEALAGVGIVDIHYRGGGPAMADLLANQVQMFFDTLATALPHHRSGAARILAISTEDRSPLVPDVPTFREIGYPGMTQRGWLGLFAPAGTPRPIVERLNREVRAALGTDELKARMAADGFVPMPFSPEQFGAFIREDLAPWERTIRALNLTVED